MSRSVYSKYLVDVSLNVDVDRKIAALDPILDSFHQPLQNPVEKFSGTPPVAIFYLDVKRKIRRENERNTFDYAAIVKFTGAVVRLFPRSV